MSQDFYKQRLEQYGPDDVRSLGWGGITSQMLRFRKLIAIEPKDDPNSTWLDVGCGFGDLCKHFYSPQYTGIDVNPAFIDIAKQKHPSYKFNCHDLADYHHGHDYVIASGIFCFKEPDPETWREKTFTSLRHMYGICKKGVAVNFLTGEPEIVATRTKNPLMHYTTISRVSMIVERISSSHCFIKNYLPNDFTVYLYK